MLKALIEFYTELDRWLVYDDVAKIFESLPADAKIAVAPANDISKNLLEHLRFRDRTWEQRVVFFDRDPKKKFPGLVLDYGRMGEYSFSAGVTFHPRYGEEIKQIFEKGGLCKKSVHFQPLGLPSAKVSRAKGVFNILSQNLKSQFIDLGPHPLSVIIRKLKAGCLWVGWTSFLVFIRLVRPLVKIRLMPFVSFRLGHFSENTDIYLGENKLISKRRIVDIFYYNQHISSNQLKRMWDRVLPITRFGSILSKYNAALPGGGAHQGELVQTRDPAGVRTRFPSPLAFTAKEKRQAQDVLEKIGLAAGQPFVCVHARDSAYLKKTYPATDYTYHGYRDACIYDYEPAIEFLLERGFFVFRMGAVAEKPLRLTHPCLLDYAFSEFQSDFLDIYLAGNCAFFLATCSGIDTIGKLFRRPIAYTNLLPVDLLPTWGDRDLFMPKKLWWRKESRFLTISEILQSEVGRFIRSELYDEFGLDIVNNTPEDILQITKEMTMRLNGSWPNDREEDLLQEKFRRHFVSSEMHGDFNSRVGSFFIRNNQDLLEKRDGFINNKVTEVDTACL